ncbi:hypothetical protein ACL9Z5_001374 [Acinetobacter calcoaceticus]
MSEKNVIALRLPDKKPTDLKLTEMAELFKQFASLLKGVNDNFGYVEEGSIYLGSPPLDSEEYKIVIDQVMGSVGGSLDHFLCKHPDWGDAQIGVHKEGESPKEMSVVRSISTVEKPNKFKQNDCLRGRINKVSTGKENHYLGIIFLNNQTITTKIKIDDVNILKGYLGTDTLIDFNGLATYSYGDDFQLNLEDFKLTSYEILEPDSIEKWIEDFVGFGKSGWQDLEDPYKALEDERLP